MSDRYEFRVRKTHELIEVEKFNQPRAAARYAEKLSKKHKKEILAFGFFSF